MRNALFCKSSIGRSDKAFYEMEVSILVKVPLTSINEGKDRVVGDGHFGIQRSCFDKLRITMG